MNYPDSSSNEANDNSLSDEKLDEVLMFAEVELPDKLYGENSSRFGGKLFRFFLPISFVACLILISAIVIFRMSGGRPVFLVMEKEMSELNIPYEYRHLKGKIRETLFESGLKWLHIGEENLPTAICSIQVRAGSFDESRPGKQFYVGTAHLLEHSVFLKQTQKDKEKYTFWNAFTDNQQTQYILAATYENFPLALQLTSNELFNFQENPNTLKEVTAVNSEYRWFHLGLR